MSEQENRMPSGRTASFTILYPPTILGHVHLEFILSSLNIQEYDGIENSIYFISTMNVIEMSNISVYASWKKQALIAKVAYFVAQCKLFLILLWY